ncbi:MAG: Metallo-beta-lactamase domain protein, partial [Planctomycetota bacterium]
PTTVDVMLSGDEVISFGDVRFRVLDTPGHTLGSTCYLMERRGRRVLFSGDVIVRLGEKPLGTYSAYLPPRYRGDARSYLASLQMLRRLPVPDLVLPGHPRSNSMPRSPRLTQAQWEELYYFGDFHGAAVYGFFADSKFFVVDAPGGSGLADFLKSRQREFGLTPVEPTAILLTACGEKETGGLSELVERSHAIVVTSPDGVDAVQQLCSPGTTVISADDLAQRGWFSVTPLPLGGRGLAPIAYVVRWGEKTVLFSGRIPMGLDQTSRDELLSDLTASKENPIAFLATIRKLSGLRPDLWLPAAPSNGQNANLYDRAWNDILEQNSRVGYQTLPR